MSANVGGDGPGAAGQPESARASGPTSRPCKACGMPIEFHVGPNGRPIPLQRIRTLYWIEGDRVERMLRRAYRDAGLYVSHFETCPKASSFSRPKGK